MKIVLVGYMASGKSAVGMVLSKKIGIQFIDLDSYIEAKEQLTITEIFDSKGEIYFRIKEGEYLQELLNLKEDVIISLGGGTPCYGDNMKLIETKSNSFYLKASINTIYERLKNDSTERPLVSSIGKENLKEYIAKHLFERTVFYQRAKHTITVNEKSVLEIIEEIKELL